MLGIVLLLGMSPLPQAEAKIFIIDDFSKDPDAGCDIPRILVGTTPGTQIVPSGVIGGIRDCSLEITVASAPSNGVIDVVGDPDDTPPFPAPEMFRCAAPR